MKRRNRIKPPPQKVKSAYRQLWRVVDGAVATAFALHPNYLAAPGQHGAAARRSIAKRVVGAVLGYAEQSARSRSGDRPAADKGAAAHTRGAQCGRCHSTAGSALLLPTPVRLLGDELGDDASHVIPAFLALPT